MQRVKQAGARRWPRPWRPGSRHPRAPTARSPVGRRTGRHHTGDRQPDQDGRRAGSARNAGSAPAPRHSVGNAAPRRKTPCGAATHWPHRLDREPSLPQPSTHTSPLHHTPRAPSRSTSVSVRALGPPIRGGCVQSRPAARYSRQVQRVLHLPAVVALQGTRSARDSGPRPLCQRRTLNRGNRAGRTAPWTGADA
jgi:hypothetical protein